MRDLVEPVLRDILDAQMSEAQFQAEIVKLARINGWLVYHPYDSRRSPEGYPDLTLAHPNGRLIFAEVKTTKGKTTAAQDAWLAVLGNLGRYVDAYVWRPSDWNFIHQELTV
jgi:hypothetical protein